ncbi:MAG: YraN family protein [Bacteroidota bacterium]|nr:YraN family protein [Bacteroidota bacterium]
MAQHNDLGNIGEQKAKEYLVEKEYDILETNWRYRKAEIDIIAQKGNKIIAVEVKTRSSLEFGNPQEFINQKKIKLLVEALDNYIVSKDIDLDARFDIVSVYFDGKNYNVDHIEDAFLFF